MIFPSDDWIWIGDQDVHQKAVELRFGQRVGAFLFDRVLGREHHEKVRHFIGFAGDRDLTLFHGFEEE